MATVGPILHMLPLTLWRQEVHGYSGTHFTYAPFNSLKARGPWLQWDPFYICSLYPTEGKRPRAKRDPFYPCPFSLTPWRQEAQDYSGTHFIICLQLSENKRLMTTDLPSYSLILMATVEAALCIPLQLFRRLYFLFFIFYLSNQLLKVLTNLKSAWSYTDWSVRPSGPENNDSHYPLLGVLVQVKAILDGHCLRNEWDMSISCNND